MPAYSESNSRFADAGIRFRPEVVMGWCHVVENRPYARSELFQSITEGERKDETSGRQAGFDSQVILNEVLVK